MGTISDGLRQDHEDMRTMVAVLMEMANRLDIGQAVPADDLHSMLGYMDVFVGRCHQAKEETLLFPALEEVGVMSEGGPLEIMSAEHQLEGNLLQNMADAASRYSGGDEQAGHTAAQYARDYSALLSRDMDQEDELIYPMAEQRLPDVRQKELASQFADLERGVLGPGRHDTFHATAHALGERYLN